MTDIKLPLSALEEIYADNDSGLITAQRIRNGFKSSYGSQNVSTYTTSFTPTRDDIFIVVNASTEITATLPAISAYDGSGDYYRNKIFEFDNIGTESFTLTTSAGDLLPNGNTSITVGSGCTYSIIGVSGVGWRFLNTNTYDNIQATQFIDKTLVNQGKKNLISLNNGYITSGTDLIYPYNYENNVIIPYYLAMSAVTTSAFDEIITTKIKHPQLGITVVLNPAGGYPLSATTPTSASILAIENMQGVGISVLGYVTTFYGGTEFNYYPDITLNSDYNRSDILPFTKDKVDEWYTIYPTINGIFYDEVWNGFITSSSTFKDDLTEEIAFYKELTTYVRNKNCDLVLLNPGNDVSVDYFNADMADAIIINESSSIPAITILDGSLYDAGHQYINRHYKGSIVHTQPVIDLEGFWRCKQYCSWFYSTQEIGTSAGLGWQETAVYLNQLASLYEMPLMDSLTIGIGTDQVSPESNNPKLRMVGYYDRSGDETYIYNPGTIENNSYVDGLHINVFRDTDDSYKRKIDFVGVGNYGAGDGGADIRFWTNSGTSATASKRLSFNGNGKIQFNNKYTFPDTNPTENQLLVSDSNGDMAFSSNINVVSATVDNISATNYFNLPGSTDTLEDIYYNSTPATLNMKPANGPIRLVRGDFGFDDHLLEVSPYTDTTFSLNSRGFIVLGDRQDTVPATSAVAFGNQITISRSGSGSINFVMMTDPVDNRVLKLHNDSDRFRISTYNDAGTAQDDILLATKTYITGIRDVSINLSGTERFKVDWNGVVTFNDEYTFPTTDGTVNSVFVTDGHGSINFRSLSAGTNIEIVSGSDTVSLTTTEAVTNSIGYTKLQTLELASTNGSSQLSNESHFTLFTVGESDFKVNSIMLFSDSPMASATSASKVYTVGLYNYNTTTSASKIIDVSATISHIVGEYSKSTTFTIADTYLQANNFYYVGINGEAGGDDIRIRMNQFTNAQNPATTVFKLSSQSGLSATIPETTGRTASDKAFWARMLLI